VEWFRKLLAGNIDNVSMRERIWIFGFVSIVLGLSILVTIRYGFGFAGRTLFEWMDIFIVPIAVGIALYTLEQLQRRREQNEQRQREEEREQREALLVYLDQMGEMLLDEERPLRQSQEGDQERTLARARTHSVLGILDPVRKGQAVKFLYESELISTEHPIVSLVEADLNEAFLRNQTIHEIDLVGAYLREASLAAANLGGANLHRADLSRADLSVAYLPNGVLRQAKLSGADLTGTYLNGADLSRADLRGADLRGADLRGADLSEAYLTITNLSGTNLDEASLIGADLSGAAGITAEELEQRSLSLEGAIMPNGQKYEDWLLSQGRGENGRNSGTS
jgi:uncharacterized protein YjbI with pentapeptide repeats